MTSPHTNSTFNSFMPHLNQSVNDVPSNAPQTPLPHKRSHALTTPNGGTESPISRTVRAADGVSDSSASSRRSGSIDEETTGIRTPMWIKLANPPPPKTALRNLPSLSTSPSETAHPRSREPLDSNYRPAKTTQSKNTKSVIEDAGVWKWHTAPTTTSAAGASTNGSTIRQPKPIKSHVHKSRWLPLKTTSPSNDSHSRSLATEVSYATGLVNDMSLDSGITRDECTLVFDSPHQSESSSNRPRPPLVRVLTPPLLKQAKRLMEKDENLTLGSALGQIGGVVSGTATQQQVGDKKTVFEGILFFNSGVYFRDLVDAAEHPPVYKEVVMGGQSAQSNKKLIKRVKDRPKCPIVGTQVHVNGKEVALFRFRGNAYAMLNKCSHGGGPIGMGDVEELPFQSRKGSDVPSLVVTCPWHGYQFDAISGECYHDKELSQATFQTQVAPDGEVLIGFQNFDPTNFDDLDGQMYLNF